MNPSEQTLVGKVLVLSISSFVDVERVAGTEIENDRDFVQHLISLT